MSITDIISVLNFLILLGIVGYLIVINKYLDKNDIVDYVSKIFKISEKNLKKDLHIFLEEVKNKYTINQNEILNILNQQQEEVEKLKQAIVNEALAFKKYCQDRVKTQEEIIKQTENRLQEAQKHIAKLENMLLKCRKKLKKANYDNETTQ